MGNVLLDGRDVNLKQVLDGYAWHSKKYENEQSVEDGRLYSAVNQRARSMKLGLGRTQAQCPWEWRARTRNGL
ncbi:MAG: thermonuclease family protein [Chromatiales bacterium]